MSRITLTQLKAIPSEADKWTGRTVRIYCGESGQYWTHQVGAGYGNRQEAALWKFEDAVNVTRGSDPKDKIGFEVV